MWTEIEPKVVVLQVCRNPLCCGLFDEDLGSLGFCGALCRKRFMAIKAVASLLVPVGKERHGDCLKTWDRSMRLR